MCDENRDFLFEFINKSFKNSCVVAEIGVWTGFFSDRILKESNIKQLYLIDPWIFSQELLKTSIPSNPYCSDLKFKQITSQNHLDDICNFVINKFSNNKKVKIIREKSDLAYKVFQDNYFNWIYLDGDHSYEAVFQDLNNWISKIKQNGFIIGDDFLWKLNNIFAVKEAVNEFLLKNKNVRFVLEKNNQFILQKL